MCKAGQHHMLEPAQLVGNRGVDLRVTVAKQVDPPGTDAIENALAFKVFQPHAFGTRHRHQWQGRVLLHLRAGMPHRIKAALQPGLIVHPSAMCSVAPQPIQAFPDGRVRRPRWHTSGHRSLRRIPSGNDVRGSRYR